MCKVRYTSKCTDLYVTHFPCLPCTKTIIQAGIKNIYYAKDYKNSTYALELFAKANVQVVHIPFDEAKIDFYKMKNLR